MFIAHLILLDMAYMVYSTDRQVTEKDELGEFKTAVKWVHPFDRPADVDQSVFSRPFIIDLESTNGTYVNGEAVPVSRFYELKIRDGISQHISIGCNLFWISL
jgi:hypothetical protein